jgi:hypothetical protein
MSEDETRLDTICKRKGLRLEQITVEKNEGASHGYAYGAWVGEFELGSRVGNGSTPDAAIEDLLDQLEDLDTGTLPC